MSEEHNHEATGREAVRLHFVQRLAGSGLKPAKGLTEAQHAEAQKKLVEFLSYLSVPSLVTLADQVLTVAGGKGRDSWPSELVIRQMAEGLEKRPVIMAPIVTSWLASIEGPKAEAGGYLAQLFRHLRTHPRPVMSYDLTQIRQQAADDRRREAVIQSRAEAGLTSEDDLRWRADLAEDLRQAREIIDRAARARAEKLQTQGAAA